jgi:undecaprenyl-diphosphatase
MWRRPDPRQRWLALDRRLARRLNRLALPRPGVLLLLALASRLGDGVLWYSLIALFALAGGDVGLVCAAQMLAVGGLNLLLYRALKDRIGRTRPFVDCPDIRACAQALDHFSFPSGHTLHAVAFTVVISAHFPDLAPATALFASLVAASRVVLGLHYPSDVVAGAMVGAVTSGLLLYVWA